VHAPSQTAARIRITVIVSKRLAGAAPEGTQVITGHDTVFVAGGQVDRAIQAMLDDRYHRWPEMVAAIGGVATDGFQPWPTVREALPAGEGEVLIARDTAMEQHWDDLGYSLIEDAEGPFAVSASHRSAGGDWDHRPAVAGGRRPFMTGDADSAANATHLVRATWIGCPYARGAADG
jgi:hypothetical protein